MLCPTLGLLKALQCEEIWDELQSEWELDNPFPGASLNISLRYNRVAVPELNSYNCHPCAPAEGKLIKSAFLQGRRGTFEHPCKGSREHCLLRDKVPPLSISQLWVWHLQHTWLLPSLCCHHYCVVVRHSLTQKGGRTTWLEINSCHGMLGLQPGTRGKLLPCFPNSLFAHLTQQKGAQTREAGQISTSFSGVHKLAAGTSNAVALFLLFPHRRQVFHSLTHLWSPILWCSGGLPCRAHTVTISSPLPSHTCFHSFIEKRDHLALIFTTSWFYTSFCQWYRETTRKAPWHKPQAVLHRVSSPLKRHLYSLL